MRLKKFISNILIIFLIVIFVLSMAFSAHAETVQRISGTYSQYIYSYDLTGQEELFGKNETKKMYPASITKVLAAEAMLEQKKIKNFNAEATTIKKDDIEKAIKKGLYVSGLTPGEKVTWNDLFHSMLYMSGAEACYALLRVTFDGNEKKAAEKMNEIAKKLAMKNSHFENITGAHAKNHSTTAKDFSKVLIKAWKIPYLHALFTAETYTTSDKKHIFRSPVRRYKTACGQELIGGKTGFTTPAQHTFAGFSRIKGHIIITVTGYASGTSQPHMRDAKTINSFISQNFHEITLTKNTKNSLPEAQKELLNQSSAFRNKILVRNGGEIPFISEVRRTGGKSGNITFSLGDHKEKTINVSLPDLPEEKKKITKSSSTVVHAKEGNIQKKHQNIKTGDKTDLAVYYSALTVIFICAAGMIFSIKKNIKS